MPSSPFVEKLNHTYFEGTLSGEFQEQLGTLPIDRPDVLAFIERMFMFMQRGKFPASDLSSLHGDVLGTLLARILPGAWEGRVPPITVPGRHKTIDEYLTVTGWLNKGPKTMLDLGCGFPPHTTIETAQHFPEWQITGADPSLPVYLVYDKDGNYCTFNEQKEAVYFQPALPSIENWNALLSDANATRHRFTVLLNRLIESNQSYAADELPRLSIDPVHHHSQTNLNFMTGGIGQLDIDPVDVIRCFNVLFYFDDPFRERALAWFATKLNEGGILVTGSNWALSTESRYYTYQKEQGALQLREFAFSLDNFSPVGIVTWYAVYDDDREADELAKYLNVLRSDDDFVKAFYAFQDPLRERAGICPRNASGYYGAVDSSLSPVELWGRSASMSTDLQESVLVDHAITVLNASGYHAARNEVGHISIRQS